ncbi:MAG: hypothetical protein LUQ12_04535 [Methanoregulaceae archaeon]|nr:hypothetical protein [Methanoregulaceae archaeon]
MYPDTVADQVLVGDPSLSREYFPYPGSPGRPSTGMVPLAAGICQGHPGPGFLLIVTRLERAVLS